LYVFKIKLNWELNKMKIYIFDYLELESNLKELIFLFILYILIYYLSLSINQLINVFALFISSFNYSLKLNIKN
jgi:hypothetical protein